MKFDNLSLGQPLIGQFTPQPLNLLGLARNKNLHAKTLSSKNKLRHRAPCVERFWKRPRDQGATINQNLFGKKFCDNRCQLEPCVLVSLQVPPLVFCLADHQHGAAILSDQRDRLFTTEPAYGLNHPREGTANWERLLPTHTCSTLKRCLKPNRFI